MSIDVRLANKGRSEPHQGLVQQGRVHVALASAHAAELGEYGWPLERTERLEAEVGLLDTEVAARVETVAAARRTTQSERDAIAVAKAYLGHLRTALPMVMRDSPASGVTLRSFAIGGKLRHRTPTIIDYLGRIRASVLALDEALKPYFKGESAAARLDLIRKSLEAADTAQETSLLGLPAETLKVYERKGRVLELIEDLNRVAKIAFKGDAELAAKFTKELLGRARNKRRAARPGPDVGEAPGPTPVDDEAEPSEA